MRNFLLGVFLYAGAAVQAFGQKSVAREWNETLLQAIREDLSRPTVHARNLWHTSIAMYDSWAVYGGSTPYLLGKEIGGFKAPFNGIAVPVDVEKARAETLSYASYRVLMHRFKKSPGASSSQRRFRALFKKLGYKASYTSTRYSNGSPAALGNYIASMVIKFGLQDGANEKKKYRNQFYAPVNPALVPSAPGYPNLEDANRWQSLSLEMFVDQSGNALPAQDIPFLSPEWGDVTPFALDRKDLTVREQADNQYRLYHDPGPPPYIDPPGNSTAEEYKQNFLLVSLWSSHLDPKDGVLWDISPASIGNNGPFPTSSEEFRKFYNLMEGGDTGRGHKSNPVTGKPYEPQIVLRGDYTRVLAEFWADGPDSETPPGHWYAILNYVGDHAQFEKRYQGAGEVMVDLEWDVKGYFMLGGAVHDAAIAAWGIKGWYDYIRPISAIRFMADVGQCSDRDRTNFSEFGIPLVPGFVELVEEGDSLAGLRNQHIGKIKLYAWRGHSLIEDPETDEAGVGWILAENWWPYQRPSFVTPPFAGYISGHSTFSRAAAEILTLYTGDEFFPGGIGEFTAKKGEFLIFEDGPSVDVILQWATYRDASDQTSLSRIWGGIHPPVDDIPGRIIGEKIGRAAFEMADSYFVGR